MTRALTNEEVILFEEVLNRPDVMAAYKTLIRHGLLALPTRAEIFCAYCGDTICYTAPERNRQENTPYVLEEVAKHRAGCAEYQAAPKAESLDSEGVVNPVNGAASKIV